MKKRNISNFEKTVNMKNIIREFSFLIGASFRQR